MNFLIDAQLPPSFANSLTELGHSSEHVIEVGLGDADDDRIWDYAVLRNMGIITKDEDFSSRLILAGDGPLIVWLRIGNCTSRQLKEWFLPKLPVLLEQISAGETLIEIV